MNGNMKENANPIIHTTIDDVDDDKNTTSTTNLTSSQGSIRRRRRRKSRFMNTIGWEETNSTFQPFLEIDSSRGVGYYDDDDDDDDEDDNADLTNKVTTTNGIQKNMKKTKVPVQNYLFVKALEDAAHVSSGTGVSLLRKVGVWNTSSSSSSSYNNHENNNNNNSNNSNNNNNDDDNNIMVQEKKRENENQSIKWNESSRLLFLKRLEDICFFRDEEQEQKKQLQLQQRQKQKQKMKRGQMNQNNVVTKDTILEREQELELEQFDPVTSEEIFDIIRTIQDPEHPLTLEQLGVVSMKQISVVQSSIHGGTTGTNSSNSTTNNPIVILINVSFTPTIPHCSMATLIGLCICVKLIRSLPTTSYYKVIISIEPGTHVSENAINRQLADKERVCAALDNKHLLNVVNKCIHEGMIRSNK